MEVILSSNQTKSMNASGVVNAAVLTFQVRDALPGECSSDEVLWAVLGQSPDCIGMAKKVNAEIVEYHGSGVYDVEVNYEMASNSSVHIVYGKRSLDKKWYLAHSNTVEHVLSGIKTSACNPGAPDAGNLINWNGKRGAACAIHGANILTATIRENCVLTLDESKFNTSFRKKIVQLTGCVNNRAFHGWAAGEVLFLGGSSGAPYVNDRGEELVDVTLKFAIRQNLSQVRVNGREISAGAWDIVWPMGNQNVYVSKVYPDADLNVLGVGK